MGEGGILSDIMPTRYNHDDPITLFIIQVVLIIVLTRLLHLALSRFRQPRVIAEIIGGIILGPSVFGKIPHFNEHIFPEESKPMLNLAATLGLILFLFIIGVEMNPRAIIKNARSSIFISVGGISTCFGLGSAVGYGLYNQFTDKTQKFSSFILFIGVAMSITAFPVLARILSELKLIHSPVGTAALTASANDDVTSWILLALVVSLINSTNSTNDLATLYVFLLCIAWILVVVFIVRPILLKLIIKTGSYENGPTLTMVAITLGSVLVSAFVTDIIGIHAIFGGFIMGVIIPHESGFAIGITEKIEDLVNVLFLPIYFTLSGLKTNLDLLNEGKVWLWILIVISCAIMGKIFGAGLMAKLNGYKWREALTIGIFMSCKGLVELIVLNIGYDEGVINDRIFVIMVTMAIVTTFATTPLATWIYSSEYQRKVDGARTEKEPPSDDQTSQVSTGTLPDKHRKLLVVLNKVEWLPAMMTLIQLLQPSPQSTDRINTIRQNAKGEIGSSSTQFVVEKSDNNRPLTIHALRMIPLTERISTVMKFKESKVTVLNDPIMNIFRLFGQLNFVKIKANLSVVPFQDFAEQVAESIENTGSETVIIPWNGAGAIIDDHANPIEEILGPRERKSTSPHVAQFAEEVYDKVNANICFLIDRGLGAGRSYDDMPSDGRSIKIYLPFFGGLDDREALSLVVRILNHPHVTATVERIRKSNEPTNHDTTLRRTDSPTTNSNFNMSHDDTEVQRPPLAHLMSTASTYVLNSGLEKESSDEADELLLSEIFKTGTGLLSNNPRVTYLEISSTTPLQTAIEHGKGFVTSKDLIVVGRGRRDANINHREEFIEVLKNLGLSYGNNTRKSLGDITETFLISKVASSVLVVQGNKRGNM